MKHFNIPKQDLIDYFARIPGKESTDRSMSRELHRALSSWGAQAEYLTELICVWFTAFEAGESTNELIEKQVFQNAHENAQRYMTDILRQCDVRMDGCMEIALFRVLETACESFNRRTK